MNPKAIFDLLSKTFSEWNKHQAPRLGAALAYYTIFSISPLLIIIIAIAGLVFGQQAAQNQILGQIRGLVGNRGAQLIQGMLANAYHPGTNIILTIVGLVTLLLGAIGVFGQLQGALNTIWQVQPKGNRGIRGILTDRLLDFGILLATGFLLLVSLALSAGMQAVGQFFGKMLPISASLLESLNFVLSFVVITLLFALIYKFLPDAEIHWKDVWIGAAVTALLFTIGKFLIGLYLGHSSVTSTYGAAGSLVILLIWIYYSAQILLFGAEFTRVYANTYGSRVVPAPSAVPATRPSEGARQPSPQRDHGKPTVAPDLAVREGKPQAASGQSGSRPTASNPSNPPVRQGMTALATHRINELAYQRNMAALFGFLAGAIMGARVLGNAGRANGGQPHANKRRAQGE